MRRLRANTWTIALGVALSGIAAVEAQSPPRPQPKIIVYQPPEKAPATVAVMGQVTLPGTYQFPAAPTLAEVVQAAKGLKPAASPMIRIVRGHRVAQRVSIGTAAAEKLLPGDLVIVDSQPIRDHSPQAKMAEPEGVQLALLGVVDRPVVVLVKPWQATTETVIQMLGQSPANTATHVLPPPNARQTPAGTLPDGSVVMFDPRRINVAELPDDLPKVILCELPEPDIGAYGVRSAFEERRGEPTPEMRTEGAIPWSSSPRPDNLSQAPLASGDENSRAPTLIPDDRLEAKWSSNPEAKSPISRVPFASRESSTAQPARLSTAAPTDTTAADAKEPAWNKGALQEADADLAAPASASSGLSLLQIASILTSIGLIGGFALALRARQMSRSQQSQRDTAAYRHTQVSQPVVMQQSHRLETAAAIPSPHIPIELFARTAGPPAASARSTTETRADQELAFRGLLKNELPISTEPMTMHPGLRITPPEGDGAIRRVDGVGVGLRPPHRPMTPAPQVAPTGAIATAERHIIDPPHSVRSSNRPHLRTGAESPVERALRQLEGGAR